MNAGTLGESDTNEDLDSDHDSNSEQGSDYESDSCDKTWTPSISGEHSDDKLADKKSWQEVPIQ